MLCSACFNPELERIKRVRGRERERDRETERQRERDRERDREMTHTKCCDSCRCVPCWGDYVNENVEDYVCCFACTPTLWCLACYLEFICLDTYATCWRHICKHERRDTFRDACRRGYCVWMGWCLGLCNFAFKTKGCCLWNDDNDPGGDIPAMLCTCDGLALRFVIKLIWCGGTCFNIHPEP